MIVGIRTRGRKCYRFVFQGHRWRKACWFEVEEHELRPTKGWHLLRRTRKFVSEHIWNKAPATEERFKRLRPVRPRGPSPARWIDMEKAKMRHAWYRREKALEAYRASLPAAHVHPDHHTEAQREETANVR